MTYTELESLAGTFSIASMLAGYPDHEVEATCTNLGENLRQHTGPRAFLDFVQQSGGSFDAARGRYLELFDTGKQRVSLYETEYGRMRSAGKGHDLADIGGFYQAFGLAVDHDGGNEMLDHLAVELEFYALLLLKRAHVQRESDNEGAEIVQDAMAKFLSYHLGAFSSAVARRLTELESTGYAALMEWIAEIVRAECTRLQVAVRPLDYFPDAEQSSAPRCATSLPVVQ